jgi:tetratricopeptide (TPR) repeat protein
MAQAVSPQTMSSASASASPAVAQSISNEDRVAQPPSAVKSALSTRSTTSTPSSKFTSSISRPRFFRLKWLLVPAGAIACALIAFFVWNAQRETPEKVEKLLAQAYAEQRTMEMRIPYAAHADFKQTRGDNASLLSSPEALRKATDVIAAKLKKNPDDPQWLLLSARLDLLDWNYRTALKALDRLTFDPIGSSPQYALSRGLALYEKAESESPGRQSYAEAVDWFGKALHEQPNNSVVLFNQAVACEKILAFDCASSDWERLLRIEKDPGWISEARQHLTAIQEKKTPDR